MDSLPEKPPYGSPCNGCGQCCIAVQCPLSEALFGEQELCPALEQAGNALSCGLVRDASEYLDSMSEWRGPLVTEAFALMIGAGIGCDGTADGEEAAPEIRLRMREIAEQRITEASEGARMIVQYCREEPANA